MISFRSIFLIEEQLLFHQNNKKGPSSDMEELAYSLNVKFQTMAY